MTARGKSRAAEREQGRPSGAGRARRWLPPLVTAAIAFAVFAPTLPYELVWDDHGLVRHVERTYQEEGVAGLLRAGFTTYDDPTVAPGYYRPVVLLSLRIDGALSPSFPYAYHATNVLLHVLVSLLVYGLLAHSLRGRGPALLGALLFAVHPVHVESVAFVSGRTDLLAALFALVSALAWVRVRSGRSRRPALDRAIAYAAFVLACLSKELAYVLPAVLLVWDAAAPAGIVGSWWRRNGAWIGGWIACLALVSGLRWGLSGTGLGLLGAEQQGGPLTAAVADPALIPSILAGYLRLLVFPWPLRGYYTDQQLMTAGAALIWLLALILVAAVAWRAGRGRGWLAALMWVLLFLLPVSGIVPIGGAALAERYLYLPSAGFVLAVAMLLERVGRSRATRTVRTVAMAALLGVLLWISVDRSRVWRNDIVLYTDLTRTTPNLVSPHYNLGTAYLGQGRFEEAATHLEQAVQLRPDVARFRNNLGLAYLRSGRDADALAALRRAVEIDAGAWEAWDNIGLVLIRAGRLDEGIAACRRSMAIRGDNPVPRLNLIVALGRAGRAAEAAAELVQLERISPEHARRARAALAASAQPRR